MNLEQLMKKTKNKSEDEDDENTATLKSSLPFDQSQKDIK